MSGCLRSRAGTSGHRSGLGKPHQGPTASEHQLRSPGSPGSGQRAHQRGREPEGSAGEAPLGRETPGGMLHLRGRGAQAAVGRKEPSRMEHLQRAPESQPPQVCGVSGSGSPAGAAVVGAAGEAGRHWLWSGAWASPSRGGVPRPAPRQCAEHPPGRRPGWRACCVLTGPQRPNLAGCPHLHCRHFSPAVEGGSLGESQPPASARQPAGSPPHPQA